MTIHWIIGTGRPKCATIGEKSMLTAESSGTTKVPRPTISKGQAGEWSCGGCSRVIGAATARGIGFLPIGVIIQDERLRPKVATVIRSGVNQVTVDSRSLR